MDTISEKVDFFKKIVLDKLDRGYEKVENSLDQSFQMKVEEYKEEAHQKSENYTKKFITKAQDEKKLKILEAKRNQKEKILNVKNKLIERIYESVLDKASDFIGTDEYYKLLHQLLLKGQQELKRFDSYKIKLSKKDYESKSTIESLVKEYLGDKKYVFEISEKELNGGLMIYNMEEKLKLDLSLRSIILRNKVFIGNQVQRLLDENGGVYE